MKRSVFILIIFIIGGVSSLMSYCYSANNDSQPLTPFPKKAWMQKIIKKHEFEDKGWALARRGLYDEAILEFQAAADPSLFNDEGDKIFPLWAISMAYERQGKFNNALELHETYILPFNPKKEEYINRRFELLSLIKARNTKSNKPIYEYVNYIKTKYGERIAPGKQLVTDSSYISDLIHLYDYMHDYDSGIALLEEIIKYHTQHPDKNHRSANAKHVKEYTRVKQAWELDKKTGQHGHLQEVIKTSDVIGW